MNFTNEKCESTVNWKTIVEMVIKYIYIYTIINYKVVENYYIDFKR